MHPVLAIDLHVHSTHSDGTLAPSQLAALAASRGIGAIALCDHDTTSGVRECVDACGGLGIECVPAVELSSDASGLDVHVLGYFIDPDDQDLLARLAILREERVRRAALMIQRLDEAGFPIGMDDVLQIAQGGSLGRSHIARALAQRGYARDVPDAFVRFIGAGAPFYERKQLGGPEEAIATIHRAGGLAVIAHPAVSRATHLIEPLSQAGLDGVEAYHADHSVTQRRELAELAATLGLLVTGGTDFHGPGGPNPELGQVKVPEGVYPALLAAAGRGPGAARATMPRP